MNDLDQAKAELQTFFQKLATDLIPILVNSIVKPPPPPPAVIRTENLIVAYSMPEIGESVEFTEPDGNGWKLTSLDPDVGDRILGHWMRHVTVAPRVDAEFMDTDAPPEAPPTEPHASPAPKEREPTLEEFDEPR